MSLFLIQVCSVILNLLILSNYTILNITDNLQLVNLL